MRNLKVLVCGGRDYDQREHVFQVLDDVLDGMGVIEIIEGGANGADRLRREWAISRHIPYRTFEADWKGEGRKAGPLRNSRMLNVGKPDLVMAFPGGRGTADMARKARMAGVPVWETKVVS